MADVLHVADFLLQLAEREPEPEAVTNLRLQKLLYYVQGWSFVYRGRQLFDEPMKAWPHGPVVERAYECFKDNKASPLSSSGTAKSGSLTLEERQLIEGVWSAYKRHSASALREMTHRESPWLTARHGLPADSRKSTLITDQSIRAYFTSQRETHERDPLHASRIARIDEARAQIARGESMTLDELIARNRA